jgi:hypothetical protein
LGFKTGGLIQHTDGNRIFFDRIGSSCKGLVGDVGQETSDISETENGNESNIFGAGHG